MTNSSLLREASYSPSAPSHRFKRHLARGVTQGPNGLCQPLQLRPGDLGLAGVKRDKRGVDEI